MRHIVINPASYGRRAYAHNHDSDMTFDMRLTNSFFHEYTVFGLLGYLVSSQS